MLDAEIADLRREVGRVLRELREDQGRSKLSVAREARETLRTIDGWEDGKGPLMFGDLVFLARLYDVAVSEIVERAGAN